MNLIAMIGIVDNIDKIDNINSNLYLKVDKPFMYGELNEECYELIPIEINNKIFKSELNSLNKGNLIGFKGRIKNDNMIIKIIAEKIQMF